MSREECEALLETLIAPFDLSEDLARRQAHLRCMEYADEHLRQDQSLNLFMSIAAERLGQPRVHYSLIQGMVPLPEEARLHLAYREGDGPTLTGNPEGLRYLSDLCAALADAVAPHEHVHLYEGETPLFGNSYRLTLYQEPDSWFDQQAIPPDDAIEDSESDAEDDLPPTLTRREIDPGTVAALCFLGDSPPPPFLLIRQGFLYRVYGRAIYTGTGTYAKILEDDDENIERMYVFSLQNDAGDPMDIALHLDDPDIHYFTATDLKQIAG